MAAEPEKALMLTGFMEYPPQPSMAKITASTTQSIQTLLHCQDSISEHSCPKALKQLCKIKTFVGTSANAVKTQVWTVRMHVAAPLPEAPGPLRLGLVEPAGPVGTAIICASRLWTWLDDPFQPPPPPPEQQLERALA
jgi:hypothetical protein